MNPAHPLSLQNCLSRESWEELRIHYLDHDISSWREKNLKKLFETYKVWKEQNCTSSFFIVLACRGEEKTGVVGRLRVEEQNPRNHNLHLPLGISIDKGIRQSIENAEKMATYYLKIRLGNYAIIQNALDRIVFQWDEALSAQMSIEGESLTFLFSALFYVKAIQILVKQGLQNMCLICEKRIEMLKEIEEEAKNMEITEEDREMVAEFMLFEEIEAILSKFAKANPVMNKMVVEYMNGKYTNVENYSHSTDNQEAVRTYCNSSGDIEIDTDEGIRFVLGKKGKNTILTISLKSNPHLQKIQWELAGDNIQPIPLKFKENLEGDRMYAEAKLPAKFSLEEAKNNNWKIQKKSRN